MTLSKTDLKKITLTISDEENNFVSLIAQGEITESDEKVYYTVHDRSGNPSRSATVDLIQELNEKSEGYEVKNLYRNVDKNFVKTDTRESMMDRGMQDHNRFKPITIGSIKNRTVQTPHTLVELTPVRWGSESPLEPFKVEASDVGSGTPNAGTQIGNQAEIQWMYFLAVYSIIIRRTTNMLTGMSHGKNVGAILTDSHGRVLSFGLNCNEANSTSHAEVNSLQAFIYHGGDAGELAEGFLFTSHQPCQMCAGMIRTVAPDLTTYYGQADNTQGKRYFDDKILAFDQSPFMEPAVNLLLNQKSTRALEASAIKTEISNYFDKTSFDGNSPLERVQQHLKTFILNKGCGV